jgi:hypothetical protein
VFLLLYIHRGTHDGTDPAAHCASADYSRTNPSSNNRNANRCADDGGPNPTAHDPNLATSRWAVITCLTSLCGVPRPDNNTLPGSSRCDDAYVALGDRDTYATWILSDAGSLDFVCNVSGLSDIVETGTFSHSLDFMFTSTNGWSFESASVQLSDNIPVFSVQLGSIFLEIGRIHDDRLSAGEWFLIRADCVSWSCTLSVNGKEWTATSTPSFTPVVPNTASVRVGRNSGTDYLDRNWPGQIKQVRWSSTDTRAVSPAASPAMTPVAIGVVTGLGVGLVVVLVAAVVFCIVVRHRKAMARLRLQAIPYPYGYPSAPAPASSSEMSVRLPSPAEYPTYDASTQRYR